MRPRRAINAHVNAKGEHMDQWVRGAVSSKALAYIHKIQENRQALLVLLIVSTTLAKYGERGLSGAPAVPFRGWVLGPTKFDHRPRRCYPGAFLYITMAFG
ncbi:hypothetical protein PF005_g7029 [Phytophthora fragariae]|uniref:Uncharacterized protein n=1 Tax=Phytophthora fragariae TaxID=53985 RepID=A0A6A3H3C4_9STRA|nr:hypothetical protein PF003_g18894 [Phytophthora fragariae]KAE8897340.1 hypothetical protein PF003_g18892 [Phytophthora fragariae]KAE8942359.1 hypothetical protein PF009_g7872 [Phytophthora fragariae]KAE8942365.1 hypothetical protein PF009_g7874 [Phytophthora fragariae]KAE8963592.1 hypothetical protein PF011_g28971 [Phytophthora fragariae]